MLSTHKCNAIFLPVEREVTGTAENRENELKELPFVKKNKQTTLLLQTQYKAAILVV